MINPETELKRFVKEIFGYSNITRKHHLIPIIDMVNKESYKSENILSSMWEDSAAFYLNDENDENLVLLTTDEISDEFSKNDPESAGFCAILAGIDDIYACGGLPIAASCIISSDNETIRMKLMRGILKGSKKFHIPIIRGHTADNSKSIKVSATLIGKVNKKHYISAGNAKNNDDILVISDFEGKIGKNSDYYWDTITFKDDNEIIDKRKIMLDLAQLGLLTSSKDISNSGIFGSLLLLLKYAKKGAKINLELVKIPEILKKSRYDLVKFSKMYLTTSYLVTCNPKNTEKIINLSKNQKMTAFKIGKINNNLNITVKLDKFEEVLINMIDNT
jgi:selenophosphate synthetase-related protein